MPPTKLSVLTTHMQSGRWVQAMALAAKFHDLGEHKKRITRAHDAQQNPGFYLQIGKDPDALLLDGIAALKERYE